MFKLFGISLLEILMVLFLAAIIAAFSIPSFEKTFEHAKQKTVSESLLSAINFARNEAIVRSGTVTLCHSEDQKTCHGDWSAGYLVLMKNQVLFSFQNKKNQDVLHWRAFPYYLDHLEFLASGKPNFQNGTFWYCPEHTKNPVWAIVMNQLGRTRLVYPDDSNVIVDDNGKILTC